MRRALILCLLAFLLAMHIVAVRMLTEEHTALQKAGYQEQLFVLPAPILKVAALDYDGFVSDFLFIKGLTYIGGFISDGGSVRLSEAQWKDFANLMDVSTDMDPYFQDPYYIANFFLAWDAGMARQANKLLEKGIRYRDWDWSLPFFSGFNYFYFLQDNERASPKLMEASKRPGAPPFFADLASRLAINTHNTENSIYFLEEMIKKTEDETQKKRLETRVTALEGMLALEKAVDLYQQRFKRKPANLDELLRKNIIKAMPKDPYGGKFYIDPQGNISSTSKELVLQTPSKK